MTEEQHEEVAILLRSIIDEWPSAEFHHGDCVGVDVETARLAKAMGYKVVCHPPEKDDLRAMHGSDEFRKPLSYFARNRAIVDETEVLLVIPQQDLWQPSGGTWYTHDYGVKKGTKVVTIWPTRI